MILFPAIDLHNGKVVRLKQGRYDQVTVYGEDPLDLLQSWEALGAQWAHMVDLDAAKSGQPAHRHLIEKIAAKTKLKLQVGGGVRNLETARQYLESGVSRVVVGTQATQDLDFLAALGSHFPQQIALGLDAKDGKLAVHGWTQTLELKATDFLQKAPLQGIACLIYTDIARDGMLTGPNLKALQELMAATKLPVISSGGVSSLQDIQNLLALENCQLLGVIVGKALYEGKVSVAEALRVVKA